ncbi:MAG: hypothetical protein MUO27_02040, partial [Sedimentisphaerales bacterium]|nr:hypothetical protein [Sedimentisphaerales bacterium]
MNQRKLRFLVFLACLSLISSFAKMPTAYPCPPPECPDCTIRSGSMCLNDCRTPECCINSFCYCEGGCEDCCVDCWCPEVGFPEAYKNQTTCVGCEVEVSTEAPNYGDYFPGCCDCLGWATSPYPVGIGGGECWFIHTWLTTGLKEVKARLPCGSEDVAGVWVFKIEKVEMEVNGSWQDVTGANITVLKGTRYTFKATLEPTTFWPSDVFSWSGVANGN